MMIRKLPRGRIRVVLSVLVFCLLFGAAWTMLQQETVAVSKGESGTLEKMIAANGEVAISLDLGRLNTRNARASKLRTSTLQFSVRSDEFFSILVFNDELRGPLPSSLALAPKNSIPLPAKLTSSLDRLVVESLPWGGHYELVIRDSKTGFVFFNIEGQEYDYQAGVRRLNVSGGRLLISEEFAAELGRSFDTSTVVGNINISATMRPIEVTHIADGEATDSVLPPMQNPETGTVPGPDVVVGDLVGLFQPSGTVTGTQVGLAVGTDSCNFGTVNLNWFRNPNNDHPAIPQNLFRMSGGPNNNERFEQIGQSQVKHAFTALTNNICNLGCNGVGGTQLGSGCSDPYSAGLNAGPNLGSRAWINPFTGFFPRDDSATPNNNHTGHSHVQSSHRILTEISDLSTSANPGATYYAEAQYITPHEYAWCQANPGQCNMYNNVSYRQYNVIGTGSPFTFSPVGSTVRMKSAIAAWTGATLVDFQPEPGVDGVGTIGYKVTNPSAGVWHYEYAIYNQNLDRAIQSFGIPFGTGVTLSNVAFHAPPQHPGSTADGTMNNAGFSNGAWSQVEVNGLMTWSSETIAQNPNANAVRWGTLYNIRFDSNRPPMLTLATIGFLKTGNPITVRVMAPSSSNPTCSRVPPGVKC